MSFLEENLRTLADDLAANPMRISAYHDLPFAIFRYDPEEEFDMRKHLRLIGFGLEQRHNKRVRFISLARLVWKIVSEQQGLEYLYKVEQTRGFRAAQDHIHSLLSSPHFRPIADELLGNVEGLNPDKNIVFLVRAGGFAPGIYRCSVLLDEMHRRTMVPIVFFYPGTAEHATDLSFYNLPAAGGLGVYNYRVKVYGVRA
jgi:bacteriophage exclusion system BrxB-like protein